jgi:tetratricopeptide (TPR) repeat protein
MSIDPNEIFNKLMALGPPDAIGVPEAFRRIGSLIDLAGDLDKDDGIARSLEWCDALGQRILNKQQKALLDYFRANAWANRQRSKHLDVDAAWLWEQPELQQQVFHLRRALQSDGFGKLSSVRQCQILTNLGNQLSAVGRFVEARPAWTRALEETDPSFGMALGNRGYGLMQYARSLYDIGHKREFLHFAHKDLSAALSPTASRHTPPDAKAFFGERKAEIETLLGAGNIERAVPMDGYPLGDSEDERHYRQWVLERDLFLNPLNDLGPHNIAARDILSLPTFTTDIDEPPSLIGLFDHMKQNSCRPVGCSMRE